MKSLISSTLLLTSTIFFSACATSGKVEKTNVEPKWLENANYNTSKLAASACAGFHFKGVEAQKKLAVQRAIEKIAMQKRTKVSSVNVREKFATSSGMKYSTSKTNSMHQVDNIEVSTKILDYYKKASGEICAWVVEN